MENDPRIISVNTDPDGFLFRDQRYDSYTSDVEMRFKAVNKNFMQRWGTITAGVGCVIGARLYTDPEYAVDSRVYEADFKRLKGNGNGFDHFSLFPFFGVQWSLAGPLWTEADFAYNLDLKSRNSLILDVTGIIRLKLKYLFNWKWHNAVRKLSGDPFS